MSANFSSEVLEIAPYRYSATWLIGATTYAMDRFVAAEERIFQPERQHIGGTIKFELTEDPVPIRPKQRASRKLRLKNKLLPPASADLGRAVCFDVRDNDYFNWSHQVNFFLTMALAAQSRVASKITIILPDRMPPVASKLYRKFGFDVISTDGVVTARNFSWAVSHIEVVPSARHLLIEPFMSVHGDDEAIFPPIQSPAKIFISRRGNRSLTNEAEIEKMLGERGFTKVYMEDLTVDEQFAYLRQADEIVAIHGAGLAPLEYRPSSAAPIKLIELAPVGIVTRWFGIMCEQVGGKYIAVRGRLKAEYVESLYSSEPFLNHCDDKFEIDPRSLSVAMEMIGCDIPETH